MLNLAIFDDLPNQVLATFLLLTSNLFYFNSQRIKAQISHVTFAHSKETSKLRPSRNANILPQIPTVNKAPINQLSVSIMKQANRSGKASSF